MSIKNKLNNPIIMWLVAGICCILWGSAFPCIKIGYRLFDIKSSDTASIILFAGVRFFLAGVLTIIIFSISGKKLLLPNKSELPKISVLSVFQTIIQYVLFYLGLAYTTGQKASIIQGTNVFVALIISCLIFKLEKFTANKIIGSIIGFAGVVLVSVDAFTQGLDKSFVGEILVFLCTVSYSLSSVFMKKYSVSSNPAMLSGYQFILGGAVMIIGGLIFGGSINYSGINCVILLVYMAMISAVAYSLWSILLKYNNVSKVMVCGFMTPVFGFILSALFAGDGKVNSTLCIISLVLVVIGIIVVNKSDNNGQKVTS